jgi:23S rRNA (adenine2030-N6)-methyltransferase
VPKLLRSEISIAPPRPDAPLAGSGLIVANPPFPLERELQTILRALVRLLAPTARYRVDWLSRE